MTTAVVVMMLREHTSQPVTIECQGLSSDFRRCLRQASGFGRGSERVACMQLHGPAELEEFQIAFNPKVSSPASAPPDQTQTEAKQSFKIVRRLLCCAVRCGAVLPCCAVL